MVSLFALAAFRPRVEDWFLATLLFLCAYSGSAYCFLVNDIFDQEKDRVNGKNRPIATGTLPVKVAWRAAAVFAFSYLFTAFSLGTLVLGLAVFSLAIFSLYSLLNARTSFLANAAVAFCASGSIWGIALIKSSGEVLYHFAGLIFTLVLVREIVLDWLDVQGDRAVQKPSIPSNFSANFTKWLMAVLLLMGTGEIAVIIYVLNISLISQVLMLLLIPSLWIPFLRLIPSSDHTNILFNLRFSHVSFGLLTLSLLLR